jgi:hypothetical protein
MILATVAKSSGMQSILRSSVQRITCSSKLSGGGGGGGRTASSAIKFRSVRNSFPSSAIDASIMSIAPTSFSQTSSFSTAPDLNGNEICHGVQSPEANQKW